MSKQPPPAPTASAIGPCPTITQIVGRPGTGSLPKTIAPPDHSHLRIGSRLSDIFYQEQGVPQGSILSPTILNIKTTNIVKCANDTDFSLYVDHFGIFFT